MRICLYTETALPKLGGQEFVVDALARQFVALGHEPIVLAPNPRLPLRPHDHLLPYPVVRHVRFYSTRFLVAWYRWFLKRLWKRTRFEVLHCHGLYPQGYLGGLVAHQFGTPLVLTSHGGDVFAGSARIGRPAIRRRVLHGLASADALVAISRFTHDGYLRLFPEAANIVDIPNGVDLDPFRSQAERPATLHASIQPGRYFMFLGRVKERKGADLILHALTKLGESRCSVVIAGDGEERPNLEQLAARLGVAERVHFVGRISGGEKTYLLQNALCGIVPSREFEAFGLVALEMQGAGIPVIASRLPGLAEVVADGETGWHISPGSAEELTHAMSAALADPRETRRRGDLARARSQEFHWRHIASRHVTLYEQLLDQRHGRLRVAG